MLGLSELVGKCKQQQQQQENKQNWLPFVKLSSERDVKKKLPIETWMVTQGQTTTLTASEVLLLLNDGLNITWSRDLPALKFKSWHFVCTRNE